MPQLATLVSPANPAIQQATDPTHQAARTSLRPMELPGGSFSIGSLSGAIGASAASKICVSFRWNPTDGRTLMLLRRLRFTAGNTATAFTAGTFTVTAQIARAWTAMDTGDTTLTYPNQSQKRRASMPNTQLAASNIIVEGTTAAGNTAGTRTLDTNPFATFATSVTAVAGIVIVPLPGILYDPTEPGHYPIVFAPLEGFIITAVVPATGTWTFGWDADWDEAVSF